MEVGITDALGGRSGGPSLPVDLIACLVGRGRRTRRPELDGLSGRAWPVYPPELYAKEGRTRRPEPGIYASLCAITPGSRLDVVHRSCKGTGKVVKKGQLPMFISIPSRSVRFLFLLLPATVVFTGCGDPTTLSAPQSASASASGPVKVTVLSTMLADDGIGEWGYAALVEVGEQRILFDTGNRPQTVLQNARELNLDLSNVTEVILSHHHSDHIGGLMTLRSELSMQNPDAISTVHVGSGIFAARRDRDREREVNPMIPLRKAFEASGGSFVVHHGPVELHPGVWLTGPVPRVHPERNWGGDRRILEEGTLIEDNLPEDSSLVIVTDEGLIVVSGCGHAGIINTAEYAAEITSIDQLHAAIGGFHLFHASDKTLAWTGKKLKALGIEHLHGGHCTGIEAVFQLRESSGLDRKHAVVSSVGSSFELGKGINPLSLAR
ncbi:MAG: MBL fold metallo-hydrolase [Verrucomicrobia bacterium]|nr:MAG: MBL fold metallo-hydrolase [Verrucomicrobiota bacterium]